MHRVMNGCQPEHFEGSLACACGQGFPPSTDQALACCMQAPALCTRLGGRVLLLLTGTSLPPSVSDLLSILPAQTCILAGCDFLPNIAGLGIKKAHALIRKHKDFVKVGRQAFTSPATSTPLYSLPCLSHQLHIHRPSTF